MPSASNVEKRVEVHLLGGPLIMVDGARVRLSPFQTCLLGLVYGHAPRGLTRAQAIDFLYEDLDDHRHRHRISQLLLKITERAGAIVIEPDGDWLKPTEGVLVEEVGALKGMEAWDPEPLVLLTRPPTWRYEHWLDSRRVDLRSVAVQEIRMAIEGAYSESDWGKALVHLKLLRKIASETEEDIRLHAKVLALAGSVQSAKALLEDYRKRLADEGVDWVPDRQTSLVLQHLVQAVDTHEDTLADTIPLRGRKKELDTFYRNLQRGDAELRVLAILGAPGVGKTRLATEALQRVQLDGYLVLRAQSSELERGIPFGPWLDALGPIALHQDIDEIGPPWSGVLNNLWGSRHIGPSDRADPIEESSRPRRVFEAMRLFLQRIAERRQVVLFLDDFHWADESSIVALEFVRRRWDGPGLVCIIALRPEEVSSGSTLDRFLVQLRSPSACNLLELDDVDPASAKDIALDASNAKLTRDQASKLIGFAGTNPLFLIELSKEVAAQRVAVPEAQTLSNLGISNVPLSIRNLLLDRLGHVPAPAREVLEMLAVLDQPLEMEALERLTTPGSVDLSTAVDVLDALRLVRQQTGFIEIRHPLMRSVIYAGLKTAGRRLAHQRVAEFLAEDPSTAPSSLALHFHRARCKAEAARHARLAADIAKDQGAIPEAISFLRIASENVDNEAERIELIADRGHLMYLGQDFANAAPLLEGACSALRTAGKDGEALRAQVSRLDSLGHLGTLRSEEVARGLVAVRVEALKQGAFETASSAFDLELKIFVRQNRLEDIESMLAEISTLLSNGTPVAQCRMRMLFIYERLLGSLERPQRLLREAVQIARENRLASEEFQALHRLAVLLFQSGEARVGENPEYVEAALAAAERSGDLDARFRLFANLGAWHVDIGETDEAERYLDLARAISSGSGNQGHRLVLLVNLGELAILQRNYEAAFALFSEASEHLDTVEDQRATWMVRPGLGLTALETGRIGLARRQFESLPTVPPRFSFDPTLLLKFHSRLLRSRGRKQEATAILQRAMRDIRHQMPPVAIKLATELLSISPTLDEGDSELLHWSLQTAERLKLPEQIYALRARLG